MENKYGKQNYGKQKMDKRNSLPDHGTAVI